jgi:hypothetical protein
MANTFPTGIGNFVIGGSGIGQPRFNYTPTILSQYANSPILLQLIDNFSNYIDPTENIENFYDNVWNILSAKGYGLDVWGRIVGVSRILQVSATEYFGFSEATTISADPFGQSPFYLGQALTDSFALADDGFRLLIFAKAAANIWDGSIPGLNAILRLLFPNKVVYVTDGEDMTMEYVFGWILSPLEGSIVLNSNVLPRPCGVSVSYVQI